MKTERALIATRKGLFTIARGAGGWTVSAVAFPGDNVPMVLPDRRDGALYAVLGHGHFGTKLHRSTDGGASWTNFRGKIPGMPVFQLKRYFVDVSGVTGCTNHRSPVL